MTCSLLQVVSRCKGCGQLWWGGESCSSPQAPTEWAWVMGAVHFHGFIMDKLRDNELLGRGNWWRWYVLPPPSKLPSLHGMSTVPLPGPSAMQLLLSSHQALEQNCKPKCTCAELHPGNGNAAKGAVGSGEGNVDGCTDHTPRPGGAGRGRSRPESSHSHHSWPCSLPSLTWTLPKP